MRKLVVLALALAAGGCATPVVWMKADGSVASPEQRQLAMTICQGEMQKAHASITGATTVTVGDLRQIYAGCMAQQGYIGISAR